MRKLKGSVSGFPGCCGASVVHGLSTYEDADFRGYTSTLQFATTSSENGPDTIKALEQEKFKRILKWQNSNGGRTCTLWVRGPAELVEDAKVAFKRKKLTVEDE